MKLIAFLFFFLAIFKVFSYFFLKKNLKLVKLVLSLDLFFMFFVIFIGALAMFSHTKVLAESISAGKQSGGSLDSIGAALSVGLGSIGAGIAVSGAASSALGAISEDPKIMGKTLLFVGMAEGISLFGVLIAFMILNK